MEVDTYHGNVEGTDIDQALKTYRKKKIDVKSVQLLSIKKLVKNDADRP